MVTFVLAAVGIYLVLILVHSWRIRRGYFILAATLVAHDTRPMTKAKRTRTMVAWALGGWLIGTLTAIFTLPFDVRERGWRYVFSPVSDEEAYKFAMEYVDEYEE